MHGRAILSLQVIGFGMNEALRLGTVAFFEVEI